MKSLKNCTNNESFKKYVADSTVKLYGFGGRTQDIINQIEAGKSDSEKTAAIATAVSNTIRNQTATGQITGDSTTINGTATVNNRGLINGTQTAVTGTTINNIGTGKIYGTQLAIGGGTLNNSAETINGSTTTATIAARERLDIGVTTLNNTGGNTVGEHSTFFSGGDMVIGGGLDANQLATGKASTVNNLSSTIESLGNMSIAAGQVNNLNTHFSTVNVQTGTSTHQTYQVGVNNDPSVIGNTYDVSQVTLLNDCLDGTAGCWATPNGIRIGETTNVHYYIYNYTDTTYADEVKTSDPARITAGGAMDFNVDALTNDKSQIIAGGVITGTAGKLNNIEATGTASSVKTGKADDTWTRWYGGLRQERVRYHTVTSYNPVTPDSTITLAVTEFKQNTTPTASGTTIANTDNGVQTITVTGGSVAVIDNKITYSTPNDVQLIKTGTVNTAMPSSSLFTVNPNGAGYLVETDPQFTRYKNWLSSDWMMGALKLDPTTMHKRLGDGFYEQKLIREQIAQLTGRRYLSKQTNDDEQYQTLMNAGITFAGQYNLRVGIALTAEQMARLTSDIVWLVDEEVTLPNGTQTHALVPKVYVVVKPNDIDGSGTLIAGNRINLNLSGDLNNSGTIAGRTVTHITGENIHNLGGRITGNQVMLDARHDLNNLGGTIDANTSAYIHGGHNINIASTTNTATGAQGHMTVIDRVAGIYVGNGTTDGTSNSLIINAGHTANLNGAQIVNTGDGRTQVNAVNDLNIGTVQTSQDSNLTWDASNHLNQSSVTHNGTTIQGKGNVRISSETGSINAEGANINSDNGSSIATANQGQINLTAAHNSSTLDIASHTTSSGLFSKSSVTQNLNSSRDTAQGTALTGKTVYLSAQDINVKGSSIVSDNGTTLSATHDVNIVNDVNTNTQDTYYQHEKSGLMGSGGIGFMVGSKMNSTETHSIENNAAGSTVGSLYGNTTITAGNHYQQTGSTVSSPVGDVTIAAKSVDIDAAHNTSTYDSLHKTEQKGVTVALSVPVVDAVLAVVDSAKTIGKSKNDRVNAMAVANTAWGAYKAGEGLVNAAQDLGNGSKGSGASVSITYGQSKAEQNSHDAAVISVGSVVNAGGKVNIVATGGGEKSNINIIGSDVYGGTGASLKADNAVNIVSTEDILMNRNKNQSYSANAGVALTFDKGVSVGITAGGSYGKGKSNTDSVTQRNSHVGSGGLTSIESGGTTKIAGGQVTGQRVEIDAKDLIIESRQDTSKSNSKQFDASLQATVGYGISASGSVSASKTKADYASVNEQSGIIAGDGGYNVKVKDHTSMTGGIVTSSQAAEDAGRNSFTTGTLSVADIDNHADYSASGFGIGGGVAMNGTGAQNGMTPQNQNSTNSTGQINQGKASLSVSKSIGLGIDSGHERSTTKSGINTKNITITDAAGQAATGKTVDQIKADVATDVIDSTVAENSGHIDNNYDAKAVQDEINLQVRVSQQFDANRQEAKAEINSAIDNAKKVKEDIAEKLKNPNLTDEDKSALIAQGLEAHKRIEHLQNGGLILDSIAGALSATTNSVAGIAVNTLAPEVASQIGQYFKENDIKNAVDGGNRAGVGSTAHAIAHGLLAAAVSAAGGGSALDVVTSAIAAGGSEVEMPVLSKYLFGTDDSEKLTADQKSTLSAIVGLAGAATGAANGASAMAQTAASAQNAVENNWGEVGHYSTTAVFLNLAGFSAQDAKAIALAAWAPDTDSRNAITVPNIEDGKNPLKPQQLIHALDGEKDPAKVRAMQVELYNEVLVIFKNIKRYENDPINKAKILMDPNNQDTLHKFGDSFAHVQSDGTHYDPVFGHAGDGTVPDDPYQNKEAYMNFATALFKAASSVTGSPLISSTKAASIAKGVTEQSSEQAQVNRLGIDANNYSLAYSPVHDCGFTENCVKKPVGSQVNSIIKQTYNWTPTPRHN